MRNFRKDFFQFQKIAMDLQIEDAIGKKVSALLVVTEAIKYIRERALACLARHQPQMREHQLSPVGSHRAQHLETVGNNFHPGGCH